MCFLYSVADAKIIQHHIHLAAGSSTICSPNVQSTNFYKELIKLLDGAQEEDQELSGKTPLTRSGLLESGLTELAVNENYFAIGKYDGSIEVIQLCYLFYFILILIVFMFYIRYISEIQIYGD